LGPERYSALAVLWALVALTGPGLFLPVEQEISRALAHRQSQGLGSGPVVRRAAVVGIGLAMIVVVITAAFSKPLSERLFDDQTLLLVGFGLSLIGYACSHLTRGTLSGTGRFRRYALLLGVEGVIRVVAVVGLMAFGVHTAGPFGLVIGLSPFLAIAVALAGTRGLVSPGPEASWSEVSSAVGLLLAGSLLAQILVNAGPLVIKLLASDAEQDLAGRFLAGVVLTRVPLFLFQAVQASLLPGLARLSATGRTAEFQKGLKRLVGIIAVIAVISTLGALTVGPFVLRLVFGGSFLLSNRDLALLAAASGVLMLAQALGQAVIALKGHGRAAMAWMAGVFAFALVTTVGPGLELRVELGLLSGSLLAALVMGAFLRGQLDRPAALTERPWEPMAPELELI
jgi:O-antigen/teichoic acid export membrane protein